MDIEKSLLYRLSKKENEYIWIKLVPHFINLFLVITGFINFLVVYVFSSNSTENVMFATSTFFPPTAFYATFFVFLILYLFASTVLLWDRSFFSNLFFSILMLVSCTFILFTSNEINTIRLYFFTAAVMCITIAAPKKHDLYIGLFFIAIFIISICYPFYSQKSEDWLYYLNPKITDIFVVFFSCSFGMYTCIIFKYIIHHLIISTETVEHLNTVMNQLSEVNNQLQEYAKVSGEEAVKSERLRITRDMHDSCGYTFVNISAIMDATMSNPEISQDELQENLLTVRNMAKKGLKETRQTLHAIRELQTPSVSLIETLNESKSIFSTVTNIKVGLDVGNIKSDYGQTINSIIIHTMQESLTNSIKHGRADTIFVYFWEEKNKLTMTISDNGIGSKEIIKGIGLSGMEERLQKIHGKLSFSSPEYGGFKLIIEIPIIEIN